MAWAGAAANGDTFIYAPYFRAPLYPLVLSIVFRATGSSVIAGAVLSFLFGLLSVHLVHRIVFRRAGRGPALLAACILALNGVFLFYTSTLLITPMYMFLLLLAFFLLDREPPLSSGWFVLGLAAITRPSALLLFPLALILCRRKWKTSVLFLLPVAAVWAVNWHHGDSGTLISSQAGINFYIGSGPEADGYTSFAPAFSGSDTGQDSLPYVDNVWASSRSPFHGDVRPSTVSAFWVDRTLEHILNDPGGAFSLFSMKLLYLLSPVAIPSNYDVYYFSRYSPVLGLLAGSPRLPVTGLLLWALFPGALLAGKPRRRELSSLLWAAVLAIGILPFFVTARFVLPVIPFVVILLAPRFLIRPVRSLLLAPLGLAAGIGLAFLTADTVRTGGVNMAFHDGIAHYQRGELEKGEVLLLQAVEVAMSREDQIDLNGTDALFNLGVIAARRGDIPAARSYWEMAIERNPDFSPARRALQGLTR